MSAPASANDRQSWLQVSGGVTLPGRLTLQSDFVARFSDDRGGLYEIENALMLGYRLPRRVSVWAGYVHNPAFDAGKFTALERRARQQVVADDVAMLGVMSLSARLRLEQRWRDGSRGVAWRARPYLKLAIPLGDEKAPVLNVTEELFLNLNETPFQPHAGLDRMRTAVTLSIPATDRVTFEAGLLDQRRFDGGGGNTIDHAITAQIGIAF